MITNIYEIANKLGNGNEVKVDRGIMTRCPGHDDTECSLRLWEARNGAVRLKCHAGCRTKDVFQLIWEKGLLPEKPKLIVPLPTSPALNPLTTIRFKVGTKLEALEAISCTSTELLNKEIMPPKVYMHPFLLEGSLNMIFAQPNAGKTWFVLLLALALTRKGCEEFSIGPLVVEEQCGVVIIDGEMKPYDLQERIRQLVGPMGEENPNHPLTILTSEDMFVLYGERINLAEEEGRDAMFAYMKKNPVNKVLVLDNLTSLLPGISEKSKAANDDFNQWILSLRSMGITVIVIHHANKSGDYSGHSAKIRNLDTVIGLTKLKGPDEVCFKVYYKKSRGAKPGDALNFVLEAVSHPENKEWLNWKQHAVEVSSKGGNSIKDEQVMARAMQKKHTQAEIAEILGVSQATVSNSKKQAVKKGYLTKDGKLTDAGKEFLRNVNLDDEE